MQLQWSRTVNVHGRPGKKVPCDLHMEHLNRECKGSIGGLGANVTDAAIRRVGKSLCSSCKILDNFDQINSITPESGYHTVRSSDADIAKLLKQLHEDTKVFSCIPGRHHIHFPNFESNQVRNLSKPKLLQWFQERLQQSLAFLSMKMHSHPTYCFILIHVTVTALIPFKNSACQHKCPFFQCFISSYHKNSISIFGISKKYCTE
jgi:hypothetical protein